MYLRIAGPEADTNVHHRKMAGPRGFEYLGGRSQDALGPGDPGDDAILAIERQDGGRLRIELGDRLHRRVSSKRATGEGLCIAEEGESRG